ncbi:cold shock domain-containing protein [Pediococcus acidilactici]|nr:cold shock domain-containing protein [Pediococcus acidilactici]
MGNLETGTVTSFDKTKGYGFIKLDDGEQAFVHYSAVQSDDFKTLDENEVVQLMVAEGPKGLVAVKVFRKGEQE